MLRIFRQKDYYYPLAIWLVFLLWHWAVSDSLLLSPRTSLSNLVASHAFWLFNSQPPQASEVTIVSIDQASRMRLGLKWPWERSLTAQLVRNIASFSPKVIGLDIVFAGKSPTEEDAALAGAFSSHPRVVLGCLLGSTGKEDPEKIFADAVSSVGFVNKPVHEGVVTSLEPYRSDMNGQVDLSIETAVLREFLGMKPATTVIEKDGIRFKGTCFRIPTSNGETRLNYLVYHTSFRTIPAIAVLEKKVSPADFKDKVVLIGATDPIIHDELPTPLGRFPGVAVLANGLVMFLSQRFLHDLPQFPGIALALSLGLFIIVINIKLDVLRATLWSACLLGVIYLAFLYLRSQDLTLPYFVIFFSGATGYLSYTLYKYTNLIYISNRLKNEAILDPFTGLLTRRFFLLQLQEQARSRQGLALIGLRLRDYSRLAMDLSFEQIKDLMKALGERVASEVKENFKKTSIATLSADTLGIAITGEKRERIETFLAGFLEASESAERAPERALPDKPGRGPLLACLLVKSRDDVPGKINAVAQMERLFKRGTTGAVITEEMKNSEEETSKASGVDHRDLLDFIAYDWQERNKELENSLRELLQANKRLERLNLGALTALARAIDAKSPWTAGHSERVTQLSLKIARAMGLAEEELANLHRAGLLHDIGKIATPAEILDKPGRLTDEERDIISRHPATGARILEPIEDFVPIVPIVVEHHEWFDGSGYPQGLAGDAISLGARVLAVADVFDAVTSDRPYRKGMPLDRAMEIIRQGKATQFDPAVVEAFLSVMAQTNSASASVPLSAPSPNSPIL